MLAPPESAGDLLGQFQRCPMHRDHEKSGDIHHALLRHGSTGFAVWPRLERERESEVVLLRDCDEEVEPDRTCTLYQDHVRMCESKNEKVMQIIPEAKKQMSHAESLRVAEMRRDRLENAPRRRGIVLPSLSIDAAAYASRNPNVLIGLGRCTLEVADKLIDVPMEGVCDK